MDVLSLVLVSVFLTGGVVYIIYHATKSKKMSKKKKTLPKLDRMVDEEFLEDIENGFEGNIYKKIEKSPPKIRTTDYPDCFGIVEKFNNCKTECHLREECSSTVRVLERF